MIDILPSCVSSVYFIWDPDWAWASLGKLSALYEIALVREMAEAGAEMEWLYMGEFGTGQSGWSGLKNDLYLPNGLVGVEKRLFAKLDS